MPIVVNQLNGGLGLQVTPTAKVGALIFGVPAAPVTAQPGFTPLALLTPTVVYSEQDLINIGITAAWDAGGSVPTQVLKQCRDYWKRMGTGNPLYIMLIVNTVLVADIVNVANTANAFALLNQFGSQIDTVGVVRYPPAAYAPTITQAIDPDIVNAIPLAQALRKSFFDRNAARVRFHLEAKLLNLTVPANVYDCTTATAPHVSVVAANDIAGYSGASIGLSVGKTCSISEQINIGRVLDGAEPIADQANAYFSNGLSYRSFSNIASILTTLQAKNYIVFIQEDGQSGWFFSDDPTCVSNTNDYSRQTNTRVMDAVTQVVSNVNALRVKDNAIVDPTTGFLDQAYAQAWINDIQLALDTQITGKGKASGVTPTINLNQNVISLSAVVQNTKVVPRPVVRTITQNIGFSNPVLGRP
jgi:hypothetical protein